ncbi:RluA family pseudouridine synthase [Photobacterium ganghwense]|uniref:Pseudouridine synthase n=1 Tax=Photobacterium ganghwense TaxID=320778 RepID=A0A0J1H8V2_9GAMM|nr:RluA family pseudouridine synthase [Photobacterium ganghwense]KLV08153.1 pseudouridine synthase [Photobacterium ganghwense]PSU07278.1 RluA family pseudouridine synthase [Photobacterium ganghwense]QSV16008.1 RNA pseudouridine synthase [Photobacterium ganghwense]
MHSPEKLFTRFKTSIADYPLPERFTFPFYYQPHPLCVLAAEELQAHLANQTNWQHNFGLTGDTDTAIGKMFGVLLVENQDGEIGYLSAFSGKMADQNLLPGFVPPVFDMLAEDSFFLTGQKEINQLTTEIKALEADPALAECKALLTSETQAAEQALQAHRSNMVEGRKVRKAKRAASAEMTPDERNALKKQLSQESVIEKLQLRDLKLYWESRLAELQAALDAHLAVISPLKEKRKAMSSALQQQLFEQYRFSNIKGESKGLGTLFAPTTQGIPPAGAGECAAPKLLQYAFLNRMKPLALAEFWWGQSPKSEIRRHQHYYPACQGKCQPILTHMLDGMEVDDNPLLNNPAEGKSIDIIYQDEHMAVVNKPAEFLSVPGKTIDDSVFTRMQLAFPHATGPLIVHRLDMSTSGLMVIALTKRANKSLQKQFIQRTVQKRYTALIDGVLTADEGMINLPMRGDLHDRPRQLVCFEHGKPAETKWEVIARTDRHTKVHLYPKTGRTHQLRVHCAHNLGLNMPIIGDDLYGVKANRLHLHAETLELDHPITHDRMRFQVEADF